MPQTRAFAFHREARATLPTSADRAFEHLDDFRQLSAHMERPSAMMLGSRMSIVTDDRDGRAVGSRVRMCGKVFGIPLSLEEIVVLREPPLKKAWETVDARLLVVGDYRLGFDLEPRGATCELRVYIDYDHPPGFLARLVAAVLAKRYSRWCVARMVSDATKHFATALASGDAGYSSQPRAPQP
jgi:hypothetical protein